MFCHLKESIPAWYISPASSTVPSIQQAFNKYVKTKELSCFKAFRSSASPFMRLKLLSRSYETCFLLNVWSHPTSPASTPSPSLPWAESIFLLRIINQEGCRENQREQRAECISRAWGGRERYVWMTRRRCSPRAGGDSLSRQGWGGLQSRAGKTKAWVSG